MKFFKILGKGKVLTIVVCDNSLEALGIFVKYVKEVCEYLELNKIEEEKIRNNVTILEIEKEEFDKLSIETIIQNEMTEEDQEFLNKFGTWSSK